MAGVLLALGAAPALAQQPPINSDRPPTAPRSSGDGPAKALNMFVLKEMTQCRTLPAHERRACCEKVLHPNACTD